MKVQDSTFFHKPITSKPKMNSIILSHLELCSHTDSINTVLFFYMGLSVYVWDQSGVSDNRFPSEGNSTLRPLSRVALGTPPA